MLHMPDVVGLVVGRNLSIEMNEAVYRVVITTVFKDSALKVLREYPPLPNDAPNYNQFFQMVLQFINLYKKNFDNFSSLCADHRVLVLVPIPQCCQ